MNAARGRAGRCRTTAEFRAAVAGRLRDRREEIDETVIHRALSVAPPSGREAPGYVDGLRASIPSAIEHAFQAIELGEERLGPTPGPVLTQAASSARNDVGLEVVLRRYACGYSTLSDFLHQEVRAVAGDSNSLYPTLHRELTALFDQIVGEVSEAYRREEERTTAAANRQIGRIRRLLAGDLVDTSALGYELGGWHQALIASGPRGTEPVRELAGRLDRRLLAVEVEEATGWGWLGGRLPFSEEERELIAAHRWPRDTLIAAGRPAHGVGGWRRSHRQASAVSAVAVRRPRSFTSYEEVALLAAVIRDEDLVDYLQEAFLDPLAEVRGGGDALRETLRAYFRAGENLSSAAALLGVSRHTVAARLRSIEERLGRTVRGCRAELEAALAIEDLHG